MRNNGINGLKSANILARLKPHGTRIKYLGGCKCLPCRAANSRYSCERAKQIRAGNWNGLVSATPARKHINRLSKLGVGYKTVADIAGIAISSVWKIKTGERSQLRALNEKAILAIDKNAVSDKTLVCAKKTWAQIRWLLREGFTKRSLAIRLGYKTPALQIGKTRITAHTKMRVDRLYNQLRLGQ